MNASLKFYGRADASGGVSDCLQQTGLSGYKKSAASRLYDRYVQQLFNYGMHVCGNREAVKESLLKLFVQIGEEYRSPGKSISTRCQLFRKFRQSLVDGQRISLMHHTHESGPRLSRWEHEAAFLKLDCGFSYQEVAAIMVVRIETACNLVSQAFEAMMEHAESSSQ